MGSSLALAWRGDGHEVHAFDNLKRRGSELNLERFRKAGVKFLHGDVREPADLAELPPTFDLLVDASAEPSVLAGLAGSPAYLVDTNLKGTLHCLELARQRAKTVVFLSTSRVYSVGPLRALPLDEGPTRFSVKGGSAGISETFPTQQPRSLYGATKLASELFVQEYGATYGLRTVIDRCGVIAGAGQFGKVDQGFVALWAAAHVFGRPLEYRGFGGKGKQVRDVLHPVDLKRAIDLQLGAIEKISGETFNLGGGDACSTSLLELTELCRKITGRTVSVTAGPDSASVDVPYYVSDCAKARAALGWEPQKRLPDIVAELCAWLERGRAVLEPVLA